MSKQVKARRPYDASVSTALTSFEKTQAQQQFQQECDINTIMAKYERDGIVQHVNKTIATYGDFTSVQDYQLSLNQVIAAQEAFDGLPARVRERFGNDPAHLLTFLGDEKNRDEAVKLGLIDPPAQEPAPMKVEVVEKKSAGASPQTPKATPPSGEAPA